MLDEGTIRIIRDRFLSDGIDEFLNTSYVSYTGKLTDTQKESVRTFLRENIVLDVSRVIEFIQSTWDIHYTRSGATALLHSLHFTYKKTKHIPSKARILLQTLHIFRYRVLNTIKKDTEIVYFLDGVHPLHNSMPSYGWIEIGSEKYIKANTGRNQVNVNGAYCLETQEVVICQSESINAQSTIELYKKLEEKHKDKETIFTFRDNARYYANREVQEYLKTSRIQEMPLPPYSPNLNPIERLWLFMKKKLLYSTYYEHFHQFKKTIERFFTEEFHLYRDALKTFITDDFRVLGY